ncbi:hypothetical protein U9M48_044369 [Paspalum notatum var. saurae]|uniref:Uncharacterized protein n=1 Tax=Paspalum notatum var. saurae TaxID=547442 RepID=A0AAQ3XGM6_PASNO
MDVRRRAASRPARPPASAARLRVPSPAAARKKVLMWSFEGAGKGDPTAIRRLSVTIRLPPPLPRPTPSARPGPHLPVGAGEGARLAAACRASTAWMHGMKRLEADLPCRAAAGGQLRVQAAW